MNDQDYYTILGVASDATPDEIKARFRYLAQAYHPDKFGSDGHRQAAEEDFKRINEAYRVLSDPIQRANFDQSRQAAFQPSSEQAGESPDATQEQQPPQQRSGVLPWAVWTVAALVLAGCAVWYWGFYVPAERAKALAIEQKQREQAEARVKAELENAAKKAEEERKAEASRQAAEQQRPATVAAATINNVFVNSLGMKFVPVTGTKVLFSVWETRVKDFRVFAAQASNWRNRNWEIYEYAGQKLMPREDCPVVMMTWYDGQAFCQWLTKKERAEGRIKAKQNYRLPTDAEWSLAAGLNESQSGTPKEKDAHILPRVYPWGTQWPPPAKAGNYADTTAKGKFSKLPVIGNYNDGYATTAPVGSFTPNRHGIFDLGGNAWEWCADIYDEKGHRVMRGGSWYNCESRYLLSSSRYHLPPAHRFRSVGFRCVLADDSLQ